MVPEMEPGRRLHRDFDDAPRQVRCKAFFAGVSQRPQKRLSRLLGEGGVKDSLAANDCRPEVLIVQRLTPPARFAARHRNQVFGTRLREKCARRDVVSGTLPHLSAVCAAVFAHLSPALSPRSRGTGARLPGSAMPRTAGSCRRAREAPLPRPRATIASSSPRPW